MTVEENYVNYTNCFLESQNWVGSDDIQVDCSADPSNALCSDPDAGTRIVSPKLEDLKGHLLMLTNQANLYNDTIVSDFVFGN